MNLLKVASFFVLLIFATSFNASDSEGMEPSYFNPVKVSMMGLSDPGYVTIELENGETITTTYDGIEWEVLSKWLEEQEKTGVIRDMHMTYSDRDGVLITDNESGTVFTLVGEIKKNHPIDLEIDNCREKAVSTLDYQACNSLAMELWTIELDRLFKDLGIKNTHLEDAWTNYLDAYTEFLQSEYSNREGTIWGLVYKSHVIDLIRNQINFWGRVREW